jgi:hypothetical protein
VIASCITQLSSDSSGHIKVTCMIPPGEYMNAFTDYSYASGCSSNVGQYTDLHCQGFMFKSILFAVVNFFYLPPLSRLTASDIILHSCLEEILIVLCGFVCRILSLVSVEPHKCMFSHLVYFGSISILSFHLLLGFPICFCCSGFLAKSFNIF